MKLTEGERELLDRIRARLEDEGLRLSDDRLMLAVLRAAVQLPEDDLLKLIREGLSSAGPGHNPGPG